MNYYDINGFPTYHFDRDMGIFEFRSPKKSLYFKYQVAGSFSNNTNTWKWSWNNDYYSEILKDEVTKVKAFGERNEYTPLTQGLIDGDRYTGWEMTAMAAKVLDSIGAYRIVEDHLEFYFLFLKEINQQTYDELKRKHVQCDGHGTRRAAYVCQHLTKRSYNGFHEPFFDEGEEVEHQAWCDQCEEIRAQEGEWNDRSEAFAKIRLICDQCFLEIKAANTKPGPDKK